MARWLAAVVVEMAAERRRRDAAEAKRWRIPGWVVEAAGASGFNFLASAAVEAAEMSPEPGRRRRDAPCEYAG